MQRLGCRAKVKAKTLKLHTPGCGACTDVDAMLAVFQIQVRHTKKPRDSVPRSEDVRPQRKQARVLLFHVDITATSSERSWSCASSGVSLARTTLPCPRHFAFFFLEAFSSTHQHPRGFFSLLSPSTLPQSFISQNSISYLRPTTIAARRLPVIFFLSLSFSMCFCSSDPTVSHSGQLVLYFR